VDLYNQEHGLIVLQLSRYSEVLRLFQYQSACCKKKLHSLTCIGHDTVRENHCPRELLPVQRGTIPLSRTATISASDLKSLMACRSTTYHDTVLSFEARRTKAQEAAPNKVSSIFGRLTPLFVDTDVGLVCTVCYVSKDCAVTCGIQSDSRT